MDLITVSGRTVQDRHLCRVQYIDTGQLSETHAHRRAEMLYKTAPDLFKPQTELRTYLRKMCTVELHLKS